MNCSMDIPNHVEMGEEVRTSPKLPSRRKRSRPVKFRQEFDLTEPSEELAHGSTGLSPLSSASQLQSFEISQSLGVSEPANFYYSEVDNLPQSISTEGIQRQVTSIRDATILKGGPSKKPKLEEHSSPETQKQSESPQESQTTFSSLLHTFASQVNSRVDPTEHRSPYAERSPVPEAIWPTRNSSPSVLPNQQHRVHTDTSKQLKQAVNSPACDSKQDMSFSGMLQNFVSCVNDSPAKDNPASQPSLMNLLSKGQQNAGTNTPSDAQSFSANRPAPIREEQQSFAGLLHSFASVIDRGIHGSSHQTTQQSSRDQGHRSSPLRTENPQPATKSLLDVLHDTISRRVLESASSPQDNETRLTRRSPSLSQYDVLGQRTQLDKIIQFNRDIPDQNQAPIGQTPVCQVEKSDVTNDGFNESYLFGSSVPDSGTCERLEPEDELHPNSHQWSHIKNVLPPLDDSEDDAAIHQRYGDGSETEILQTVKQEPEGEGNLQSDYAIGAAENYPYSAMITRGPDGDNDIDGAGPQSCQVVIKEEPMDEPQVNEWEASYQNVNSTLRERLLSRIESRQSLHLTAPMSSSPSAPPMEDQNLQQGNEMRSPTHLASEISSRKQSQQHQPGLVSHLLTTGDSSLWKNRDNGSFADLLHDITSTMLEKNMSGGDCQGAQPRQRAIKTEPQISDEELQTGSVQEDSAYKDHLSGVSLSALLDRKQKNSPIEQTDKAKVPRCISRLVSDSSQSAAPREVHYADEKGKRSQKMKPVSYADAPSSSSSPSVSSDDFDQNGALNASMPKMLHSLSPRSKHSTLMMKHRWKRGMRYGTKVKQGWPKRKEDIHFKHNEKRIQILGNKFSNVRQSESGSCTSTPSTQQNTETGTMSFTDILQKLAQKCQAGNQDAALPESVLVPKSQKNSLTIQSPQQEGHFLHEKQVGVRSRLPSYHSEMLSNVPSSANLRNLLIQQGSLTQLQEETVDSPSGSPSTSAQSKDVSFSHLMQNMASTVTKKKDSTARTSYEDLSSLDPPSPWTKSISGNWLRFVIVGSDENPKVTMSVSVNLWNAIHEVKIHCHHMEVPANHWIFRRFGKRIHTKAALLGILQAISNGCSVCEGTTRGDLVHMYRNKLAPTSRWQAAAVLEDSFGTATIRSSQCELLVSGLRRSREKRCSKCSKFVDRKLKAVMYHMKKKLGLN